MVNKVASSQYLQYVNVYVAEFLTTSTVFLLLGRTDKKLLLLFQMSEIIEVESIISDASNSTCLN